MIRKVATLLAGALMVWVVVLIVLGFIGSGRVGARVTDRIGESLQAQASLGDADLGLVFGRLELEDLDVRRADTFGTLALEVGTLVCDLPPLGLALVDRTCGELAVSRVRLEVTSTDLLRLQRPKRTPIHADRVIIDDAQLVFAPSAFLPSLGRVQIRIEHAEAGPTTFRTPLSWLFALVELRAVFELPAGITLRLTYANGTLSASGSLFGSTPITLPITLPVASATDDAKAEVAKLVAFGRDIAERLVTKRAQDWIRSRLP